MKCVIMKKSRGSLKVAPWLCKMSCPATDPGATGINTDWFSVACLHPHGAGAPMKKD